MPLTLYYFPGASTLALHVILIEGKFDYNLEQFDLAKLSDSNYSGREFPAIKLENGTILSQTNAIFQYLTTASNIPGMNPPNGSMEQMHLFEALGFCGDLHHAFEPLLDPTSGAEERKAADARIDSRMGQLERWLETNNSEYWLGAVPTQADIYASVIMNWADKFVNKDISAYKRSVALKEKVFALPSMQRALKEEGLL